MKELILILLFGKAILLTMSPVNLNNNWLELTPLKTFKALNRGASLNVQLSTDDMILKSINHNEDIFSQLDKLIPDGTIEAAVVDENNSVIELSNKDFSISDSTFSREDSVRIILVPRKPFPTGVDFKLVKIRSNIKLNNVNIFWKNYSK